MQRTQAGLDNRGRNRLGFVGKVTGVSGVGDRCVARREKHVQRLSKRWPGLMAIMCVCLFVAACGRKGPLEPPPGANVPPPEQTAVERTSEAAVPPPDAPPERRFILDGLL